MTSSSPDLAAAASTEPAALPQDFVIDPEAWRQTCDPEAWAARTAKPGDRFDERAADHVCAFFPRYLRHTKGKWAGKPFDLDPWQRATLRAAFGWKRQDGTRRFRIVFIEVGRKNGKTGLAAGVALYLAFCSGEQGAEVYTAAADKNQASIAFNEAKRMRSQSPALKMRTDAFKHSMTAPASFSKLEVLSADEGTKDGLNISGLIGDEVHAWKKRLFYEVLHTATGARTEPMEVLITTAGVDEDSVWGDMRDRAEKVRDGTIDDHEFLPVLFGAGENDPIDDPATWAKANPGLGRTISIEYLRKEAKDALERPAYRNTFKRLHLNIPTRQTTLWLPLDRLDAGRRIVGEAPTPTIGDLAGRMCWGGLDLSSTSDFTALCLLAPEFEEADLTIEMADGSTRTEHRRQVARVDAWWAFWLPEAKIDQLEKQARQPIRRWVKEGWIRATPGEVVDYDRVREAITGVDGLTRHCNIREVARDRWNATHLTTQLMGDGVNVVDFGQGFASMSPAAKEVERLVMASAFNDRGNPVARWMFGAVEITQDAAENIKPVKPDRRKSGKRIDGVIAACMALGRIAVAGEEIDLARLIASGRAIL